MPPDSAEASSEVGSTTIRAPLSITRHLERLDRARATALAALELPLLALALAACAALPARLALSGELGVGATRAFCAAGGLVADVAVLGPAFVIAIALGERATRRAVGVGLVVALVVVAVLVQNGAAEFRHERGVLPGPVDLREGFGHRDFVLAELPALLGGRFLVANVATAALVALVARRLARRPAGARSRLGRPAALLAAAGLSALLFRGASKAEALSRGLHNPDALAAPTAVFVRGVLQSGRYDGSPGDIRHLLQSRPSTPEELREGARNLGFPPSPSAGSDTHPLARPLDPDVEIGERPTPPLIVAARALSRALFGARADLPIVFHVSLESMRADDVHALDPSAPAVLAPFLSAVYEDHPSAAAFPSAHQSGVRTSQALGAVMCGVGHLPFYLSPSRDLGALALRCAPDVLADAGFRARAFYGHEFVFDDMGTFLRAHGVGLHDRSGHPPAAPKGVWGGVADSAVYAAAVDAAERETSAQYNFVLTLSHHSPYTAPDDLSPDLGRVLDALCRDRGLRGEACARLKTLRYADAALERFVRRVEASATARRALVVVAGDHTVQRHAPWGARDEPAGATRIPLFVWAPAALREGADDPKAAEAAWRRLRELARDTPVSNSDVPALLLALLGESAPLRALPPGARWHTLGGQVTSPHYRSITGRGVAHGVDAHGQLFDVSERGEVRPSGIWVEALRGPDDVARAPSHDRPALALLGRLIAVERSLASAR